MCRTMSTKPLAYESLKCVMQHMDINIRIQLSQRCPSLERVEKIVPVKIQKLRFHRRMVIMNGTIYILGIHRKYHDGKPPKAIQKMNDMGGVWQDLDQYGFEDDSGEATETPGDVVFRDLLQERLMRRRENDGTLEAYEIGIKEYEEEVKRRREGGIREENGQWPMYLADETLPEYLEISRAKLLSYYYRRDQVPPPYTAYIQLTIKKEGSKEQKIEFYEYNKKYHVAMKQLSTLLFGGRRSFIHVDHLTIDFKHMIVRLPSEVTFKIVKLNVSGDVEIAYNALQHVIEASSFPLHRLEIPYNIRQQDYSHPMIRDAKFLILDALYDSELPILLKLRNKRVHFEYELGDCGQQDFLALVNDWIEKGRDVNTQFSFAFEQKNTVTDIIGFLKARLNGKAEEDGSIFIPMSETSELHISCVPTSIPKLAYPIFIPNNDRPPWLFQMLVKELL